MNIEWIHGLEVFGKPHGYFLCVPGFYLFAVLADPFRRRVSACGGRRAGSGARGASIRKLGGCMIGVR